MTTPPDGPGPFPPVPGAAPEPSPARRGRLIALIVGLAVVVAVVLAFVLRGNGSTGEPVGTSTSTPPTTAGPTTTTPATPSATPSAVQTSTPTTPGTPPASAGCPPNGVAAPAGAVPIVDVDGDGRPDKAWISAGFGRRFGITTASGATFSIEIDSASPVEAAAVVNLVQKDKLPIALVDVHREALVYSLAQCAVRPVLNAQGEQYRFDRGFAGAGTGVGCSGPSFELAGLNAVMASNGTYTVTRTFVTLDANARHATNGSPVRVATGAASTDPVVTTAQEVSCGELVAGRPGDGPIEQP